MLLTIAGFLAFALLLGISIALHEAGHMVTAKAFGMKVTEFFAGFGPRIFSFQRGETRYGLKAIPAGGYVRIVGMSRDEEIAPEDEPRAFHRQATGKRLLTLGMGGIVHFVLGFLILALVLGVVGTPQIGTTVGSVTSCSATPTTEVKYCAAERAGIKVGDKILAIDDKPVTTWQTDVITRIRQADGPLEVQVQRDGTTKTFEVTPDKQSVTLQDGTTRSVSVIGIGGAVESKTIGLKAIPEAASSTVESIGRSYQGVLALPGNLVELVKNLVTREDRDPEGPVGVVGVARISGEIASTDLVDTRAKVSTLLQIVASLNIFLGVFNLLPIPPLDGGHMIVIIIEQVRHRIRRLRGYQGEVQPIDTTKLAPIYLVGVVAFVGLSLILLAADIIDPVRLFS